jgi:hypothetical protein
LQAFRYLGPDINAGDPRALAGTVLNDLDVRYVLVHKSDLPPGDYREATLSLADRVFEGWPVVVDDDWLKVFQVPPVDRRLPYLVLGAGWAARESRAGLPARALAEPAASVLVRLPDPQVVHLEFDAYSLGGPATLEMQLGKKIIGTFPIGHQLTTITTPPLSLPAGESVVQLRPGSAPGGVIFSRIDLISVN